MIELICTKLALAQNSDSTWTSNIIIHILEPQPLFDAINYGSNKLSTTPLKVDENTTDIIILINLPPTATKNVLESSATIQ